jgi:signal peptidase I
MESNRTVVTPPPQSGKSNGAAPTPPAAPQRNDVAEIISFVKTLAVFFVIALVFNASVVQAFKIPSGSMIPTLKVGDHIFVSKFSYGLRVPFKSEMLTQWAMPRRGDVVVFTRPDDPSTPDEDESEINIIKRVIGLPGENVEVVGNKVYIDGKYLPEPYARWDEGGLNSRFGPERVPEGHIFLLGDNRDHSRDSRFWPNPFLDVRRVKGRALIIYWTWGPDFFSRVGTLIK